MKKDEKFIINPNKLKTSDKDFIDKKLKYKMTIVESKKQYNRKQLKKIKDDETV